jgi:hypothetical protein
MPSVEEGLPIRSLQRRLLQQTVEPQRRLPPIEDRLDDVRREQRQLEHPAREVVTPPRT